MAIPTNGVAYSFTTALLDSSAPTTLLASHIFEAGDVKVSLNQGVSYSNIAALPTVANSTVLVALTAAEMTPSTSVDYIVVKFVDQTNPVAWLAVSIHIPVS